MSIQKQIEKRVAAEMAAQAVPMSRQDQVVTYQSNAEAPGVYVSSDQQLQDMYAAQVAAGKFAPNNYSSTQGIDMNVIPEAMVNPNYKIAEPTRTTADAQGNIIIF